MIDPIDSLMFLSKYFEKYLKLDFDKQVPIAISLAALITSVSTVWANISIARQKRKDERRDAFKNSIIELVKLSRERDKARVEAGETWNTTKSLVTRINLNDERSYYMARALDRSVLRVVNINSHDAMVIAVNLLETGRNRRAAEYYKISYAKADNILDRLRMKRVYGRSLILSGSITDGKDKVLSTISDLKNLLGNKDFEQDAIHYEIVDTYRRLIGALKSAGEIVKLSLYLADMMASAGQITRPDRRAMAMDMISSSFDGYSPSSSAEQPETAHQNAWRPPDSAGRLLLAIAILCFGSKQK